MVGNQFRSGATYRSNRSDRRQSSSYQNFSRIAFFVLSACFFLALGYSLSFWGKGVRDLRSAHNHVIREVAGLEERLVSLELRMKRLRDSFGVLFPGPVLPDQAGLKQSAQGGPAVASLQIASHYIQKAMNGLSLELSRDESILSVAESMLIRQRAMGLLVPSQFPLDKFRITSGYGPRVDPINHKRLFHSGYDFAAPLGVKVLSVAPGVVKRAGSFGSYGHLVEVDHGHGLTTRYAHLGKIFVHIGDVVKSGSGLAQVGLSGRSTGPHLHFEVLKYGVPQDPGLFLLKSDRYK
ncbi:M23 family metallopeptidase [Candidatus Ichthyocystis hellenicum]|uniref:M23 family metallopeptidase n=1 Tax=Candidatus Ichthyocystis hellenicum TaxID=1561003 RepID=UPI000B815BBD|nr:M23 family metallopeptidase [Candidatus Ichthyocystis hellenicum]